MKFNFEYEVYIGIVWSLELGIRQMQIYVMQFGLFNVFGLLNVFPIKLALCFGILNNAGKPKDFIYLTYLLPGNTYPATLAPSI